MKTKKIPLRQCIGCHELKEKKELVRVVKTPEEEIVLDKTGKANGRGAYLCKNTQCFDKARKSSALERALKTSISKEFYDDMERKLNEE